MVSTFRVVHLYREHFQLLYLLTTDWRVVIILICLYANACCGMQTASSRTLNITGSHMAIFKGRCPRGLWSVLLYDVLVLCNLDSVGCGKLYVYQDLGWRKGVTVSDLFMRIYVKHMIIFCRPTASARHMLAVSLLIARMLSIGPVSAIIISHWIPSAHIL